MAKLKAIVWFNLEYSEYFSSSKQKTFFYKIEGNQFLKICFP